MKNPALRGVFFNTGERAGHLQRMMYHETAGKSRAFCRRQRSRSSEKGPQTAFSKLTRRACRTRG
jgi:hypothetical protein